MSVFKVVTSTDQLSVVSHTSTRVVRVSSANMWVVIISFYTLNSSRIGANVSTIARSIIDGTTSSTVEARTSDKKVMLPILYKMDWVNRGWEEEGTTRAIEGEGAGILQGSSN